MGRAGQAVTIYCPEEYTKAGHYSHYVSLQMQSCKEMCRSECQRSDNGMTMERLEIQHDTTRDTKCRLMSTRSLGLTR